MKQLLTLLFAATFFSVAGAQSTAEKAKGVIRGERRDYDPDRADERRKDVVVGSGRRKIYNEDGRYERSSRNAIDREYEAKIQSIRNNPKLSRAEKNRIIQGLEVEKARRLRERNNSYNRGYADRSFEKGDDRTYKHKKNNGKHTGWQKGKGNPHKRSLAGRY